MMIRSAFRKAGIALLMTAVTGLFWAAFSLLRNGCVSAMKWMNPKMTITAHRGGAGLGPENTLRCIERGIASGADGVEIDVHLTADGEVVVCHDPTVDRTTDGHGRIAEMTAAQIRALKVLDAGGDPVEEAIPTLDEVMAVIGSRAELLLEIKHFGHGYEGIEMAVLERIRRHENCKVTVQSFDDEVLEELHRLEPSLKLEKLLFCKLWGIPLFFDGTFRCWKMARYDYISSFNFYYRAPTRWQIKRLHALGKQVRVWTVDDLDQLPDLPFDGVITNRPDRFVEFRKKSGGILDSNISDELQRLP